ncbi:MAG: serine/threonine-protein kinase [Pirellulales bacterium]
MPLSPDDQPTAGPAPWPAPSGYDLLAEQGRGGMGVVFRARQQATGRLVALKFVRDGGLARPEERARFRIEAEAAARMRHEHIVQIVEVGEQGGWPFLAMELVEGGGLDAWLVAHPRPVDQAAAFLRTLALAVEHAHQQQVVHRDLKPANILLAPREASGEQPPAAAPSALLTDYVPKIADFGLAKRLDSDSTAWTQAGAVLGTASYMAPEQASGDAAAIGPATDVYALGAILYELLAGRPPFQAATWPQTIELVLREEPTLPVELHADVPLGLQTICLRCLEKNPRERYSSAQALADDLERFLAGSAIMAQPPSASQRVARLADRQGYEIVAEIGRGPRSVVYRALHGPLRQPVALKVFEPGLCSRQQWEQRLSDAAHGTAGLEHPQLVAVQQAGWVDGRPFVVSEHAAQGSLAALVTGDELPLEATVELAAKVADVVGYLHRQGAVHGNLKPSNVLLSADGIPRLTDRRLTGGIFLSDRPAATAEPSPLGRGQGEGRRTLLAPSTLEALPPQTLAYLAPELLADPSAIPRPNTDIYGLGLILYELLAGRPAFLAETAAETLDRIRAGSPPAPSSLNPRVPPRLDAGAAWSATRGGVMRGRSRWARRCGARRVRAIEETHRGLPLGARSGSELVDRGFAWGLRPTLRARLPARNLRPCLRAIRAPEKVALLEEQRLRPT